jgi:hypothetical protein
MRVHIAGEDQVRRFGLNDPPGLATGFGLRNIVLPRTWTMSRDLMIDLMTARLTRKPIVVFVVVVAVVNS